MKMAQKMLCWQLHLEVVSLFHGHHILCSLVAKVGTEWGAMPDCPIRCFRPPALILQPEDTQEWDARCGTAGDRRSSLGLAGYHAQ